MQVRISVPADFRFYQTLRDTTRRPFGLTECVIDGIYHTIENGNLLSIRHNPDRNSLVVTTDEDVSIPNLEEIIVNRFGLNQNLKDFYTRITDELILNKIIKPLTGLRMFQKSSPFEAVVAAIVDQQLNLAFAETLKTRLITSFGSKHHFSNFSLYEFPTPETLAALDELALREMQFTNNKSRYIIRLARQVVAGEIDLNSWGALRDEELLKKLQSIYGIGPWTAEYTAMVGYNRLNMLPVADIGLLNIVHKIYNFTERPTAGEVQYIARNWIPYRGLVIFYLWFAYEQGLLA